MMTAPLEPTARAAGPSISLEAARSQALLGGGPEGSTPSPADWLVRGGRSAADTRTLLDELCRRLADAGLPLWRASWHLRALHPQVHTTAYCWRRDWGRAHEVHHAYGCQRTPGYLDSPLAGIARGAGGVRRRLDGAEPRLDFPILVELKAQGATDYAAMPVAFSDGPVNAVTWTSDRPGGFTAGELRQLEDLLPALGLVLEVQAVRRTAVTLLDTYVGHHAGERILEGQIRRGDGETIRTPLWYCDLRGFTALSDALPRAELLAILDQYFERMAAPVSTHSGEVLKFIGDGMLAIFPVAEGLSWQGACRAALAAAEGALRGMRELNRERAARAEPALGFGMALHVGDVTYGNVGTPDRLDFTVVGPAVNLVFRLEKLCHSLGRTLLISREFARSCARPLPSLGVHRLRGMAEPQEVFTLPRDGAAPAATPATATMAPAATSGYARPPPWGVFAAKPWRREVSIKEELDP